MLPEHVYIETEHVIQSKAFFHLSGNLHTSCFSAFRYSRVVTYHESNGSRLSIALCLFNPALDFRYSFPQK